MEIFIVVGSVLVITLIVLLANRILPFQVCPICAGVSLTWLLMTVGVLTDQLPVTNYQLLITMLMGGTVVGIAYQGERKFKSAENVFLFKVPVIIIGFILVYFAIKKLSWTGFVIELVFLLSLFYLFFISSSRNGSGGTNSNSSPQAEKVKVLEEKMKNCC